MRVSLPQSADQSNPQEREMSSENEIGMASEARTASSAWLVDTGNRAEGKAFPATNWLSGGQGTAGEAGQGTSSGSVGTLFPRKDALHSALSLAGENAGQLEKTFGCVADESLQVVKARPVATHGSMSVTAGFQTIALACLEHLQSNEQGVCTSDNPEFVHQARVAIRRLRSALRVWRPLLPKHVVADFDPLWRALAQHLGETRNWDVYCGETLPAIMAAFPLDAQIVRLAEYARQRCMVNRQAARRALKSVDHARLVSQFRTVLEVLPTDEAYLLDRFAPKCLDKRARKVRELAAEALTGDAAARHRLRVAYKRLRYALEFFTPLYSGEGLRSYHVAASGLQEMLGRLNDLAVGAALTEEALPGAQGESIRHWLERQNEELLPGLGELLSDFHAQAVPWHAA